MTFGAETLVSIELRVITMPLVSTTPARARARAHALFRPDRVIPLGRVLDPRLGRGVGGGLVGGGDGLGVDLGLLHGGEYLSRCLMGSGAQC